MIAAIACLLYAGIAAAQTTPAPGAARATVEDNGSTLFYLRQANGEYQFVPEASYEEYRKWFDEIRTKTGANSPPKYLLKLVDVTGEAKNGYVELDLTYHFELLEKGWIKASLGLAGAAIHESPTMSDDSRCYSEPDPSTGKYVLWMRNDSEEESHLVQVRVKAAVRTETNGDDVRFTLNVSSAVQFQMKLTLPPDVLATATSNALGTATGSAIVTSTEKTDEGTIVTVETSGGSTLQMNWGPNRRAMQDDAPILRVVGDIEATIEDDLQMKTTANLQVTSLNGVPIDSFDIRIADDADWFPPSQTVDYQLREVFLPQGEGLEQRYIRVEFVANNANKAQTREIELKTRQAGIADAKENRITAGLFDVWQAKEQEGHLRLNYSENVIANWSMRNYRREAVAEGQEERAAFSYAAQPAELEIKATTNQPTLQATSANYQLVINESVAQVDADFIFSVPKSYSEPIRFDLNGWQSVVKFKESDVDWAQVETVGDEWIVPLLTAEMDRTNSAARLARVSLTATFPLKADEKGIASLPMIRPQIARPTAASITILTAPNLKVDPDFTADSPYQLDVLAQDENVGSQKLYLRMNPTEQMQSLRLALEKIDQQLFVVPRAAIDIEPPLQSLETTPLDSRCQVVQTFKINAFYGGIGNLLLHGAPRSALADLVIRLDGEEVGYAQLQSPPDGTESALRIDVLGQPSEAELTIEYKVSSPGAALASSGEMAPMITTIPLVWLATEPSSSGPVKMVVRPTELTISSHSGINVVAPDPAWAEVRSDSPNVLLQLESVATSENAAPTAVTLEFSKRPGGVGDLRTRVKRCWIQDALTSDHRRTRACFLLQTRQPTLTLQLPAGVETYETNWKSRQVANEDGRITLQIDPSELSHTTAMDTLEVWYEIEDKGLESGQPLEPPVLEEAVFLEPVYYQLACPSDWFCLSAPGLTEEMNWEWTGGSYMPVERIHQDRLESWAGASNQREFPPGMSQYLYSSIGAPKAIEPWFVRRRTLMAAFGGITLTLGLGLFYLPQMRRASVVGVLVAAAAAMAIFYPHHAVLIGGMAAVGLACSLFSIVLYFALGTRRPSRTVVRRAGSESQVRALPPEPPEPVSTQAGSALLKSSSAEA
ncbi:hypothetical protein LOC68_11220 [Blastopirellula sp. JC732]|uniref:F5/8 type C domain-containing protein n=1 Tax=Blastopirellula sediminis TaxID=2894196 RepID=A0A9X1MNZ9_9BACT|nr:hypothetical protein [Blastopirellula sediminis]MCC9609725.1 hypothetical protein [Blastopirellula sediminis]MCC9628969.1 hypothetical protein [Blastopirellula sediminis]